MARYLISFVTTTVGGSVGWWLGAKVGIVAAWFLAILGTAIGAYYGNRWAKENLP